MILKLRGLSSGFCVLAALSSASADSLFLSTSNHYQAGQSSYQNSSTGPLTSVLSSDDVLGAAVGHAVTSGQADYGVLKGGSDVLRTNTATPSSGYNESGYGQVSWTMDVLVSGNGGTGFTDTIDLTGMLSTFGTVGLPAGFVETANFGVRVEVDGLNGGGSDQDSISGMSQNGVNSGTSLPVNWTTKKFNVAFGQMYAETVTLSWQDEIYANIGSAPATPWTESSVTDLTHTVRWGGSTGYDALGNVLSDYHVYGQGGRDWSQPASTPEPATFFALGGGLVFLVRRKRKGQTA